MIETKMKFILNLMVIIVLGGQTFCVMKFVSNRNLSSNKTFKAFSQGVDLTLVANSKGVDVVDVVIAKLKASNVFTDDNQLLFRIACVESNFGESGTSPKIGSSIGGIWHLSESSFADTKNVSKHNNLAGLHFKLLYQMGINWPNVQFNELSKPLYSGIASRLLLSTISKPIPELIDDQENYWFENYNKDSTVSKNKFSEDVRKFQSNYECHSCSDQIIVLDGSGSINPEDFTKAKKTAHSLTNAMFVKDYNRFGLILYDDVVSPIYSLKDAYELEEMLDIIDKLKQPKGMTNTGGAIRKAVEDFKLSANKLGILRMMYVITDGLSNEGPNVAGEAVNAKNANIVTLALGVGNNINRDELSDIANEVDDNIIQLKSYTLLLETQYKIAKQTCSTVLDLPHKIDVDGKLRKNAKIHYSYDLPSTGYFGIFFKQISGQAIGYYSVDITTPSSVCYNGLLSADTLVKQSGSFKKVYVTIEGKQTDNRYTIYAEEVWL